MMIRALVASAGLATVAAAASGQPLYDNGPLATGARSLVGEAAPPGAQWSEVQPPNARLGFVHGAASGDRLADDFVVTDPVGWRIDAVRFFAFQTGASAGGGSPITAVNLRIWQGRPGDAGSVVVFGNTQTNRLTGSTFEGLYRIVPETPGTTRPIWRNTVSAGVTLPPGTYWLDWQSAGTLPAEPQSPSVTLVGQTGRPEDNARQWLASVGSWRPTVDGTVRQDMPFVLLGVTLSGSPPPPPPPPPPGGCYVNCTRDTDPVTGRPLLDVRDFACFQNAFALRDAYANCNGDTDPLGQPIFDVQDFTCYQNRFAIGCP